MKHMRLSRLAALTVAGLLVFAACDLDGDDPTSEPEADEAAPVATPLTDAEDATESDE